MDLLRRNKEAVVLLLDAGLPDGVPQAMGDTPSWVPDWNTLPSDPVISTNYFLSASHRTLWLDATPGAEPYAQVDKSNRTLSVHGHWNGHIVFCTNAFKQIDCASLNVNGIATIASVDGPIALLASWIGAAFRYLRTLHPNISYVEVTRECVGGDQNGPDYETVWIPVTEPHRWSDALDLYFLVRRQISAYQHSTGLRNMEVLYSVFEKSELAGQNAPFSAEALSFASTLEQNKEILDYFIEVINELALNDHRLFLSSDGYRGCGSKSLTVGDRIALVAGVPVPLLLRPVDPGTSEWSDTEYTTLCSAFLLGCVDGSLFKPEQLKEIRLV